jgi:hypothetical protein
MFQESVEKGGTTVLIKQTYLNVFGMEGGDERRMRSFIRKG